MDTHTATVIPFDAGRRQRSEVVPASVIWAALEASSATGACGDELVTLRLALLEYWAELHHVKCGCDLGQGARCCAPLPAELHDWLYGPHAQKTV